ncbi:MAG TPA: DNA primase [Candidatus Methanomethylophilaceae archaeon]|nr:DNA primase [Candidatus Methanomethylophilaceae archaeon]
MNIDPTTTKYMIKAQINADGIVEKPDVVGAIFGQTEGLLGDELDLRDLQKSGRIGRIEVEISSKGGKSEGIVHIPSSLDQVETVILASALETIDRVGPCKAGIKILSIEDVRITKRETIIERAKELLNELMAQSNQSGIDLTESVRQSVQMEEIIHYGKERLPAGPNVKDSDAIIVVEGRSDVLNLLRSGIKNAIAVEGTNIPKTVIDLSKERIITAFVDGDRGGELILRELFQVAEVDFVARAPRPLEVEELTQKQITKALRNKIPAEQYMEMYGITDGNGKKKENETESNEKDEEPALKVPNGNGKDEKIKKRESRFDTEAAERYKKKDSREKKEPSREKIKPEKNLSDQQIVYRDMIVDMSGTHNAKLITDGEVMIETSVKELVDVLKTTEDKIDAVVFDGVISQRILDIVAEKEIPIIIGAKVGNVTKQPNGIEIWTKEDLV